MDEAISYHAKNLVGWSLGDVIARYRGGYQIDGTQSYLETPSIIAIKGEGFVFNTPKGLVKLVNRGGFSAAHFGKKK